MSTSKYHKPAQLNYFKGYHGLFPHKQKTAGLLIHRLNCSLCQYFSPSYLSPVYGCKVWIHHKDPEDAERAKLPYWEYCTENYNILLSLFLKTMN